MKSWPVSTPSWTGTEAAASDVGTIGQLAANIAHEVGTPLNVIGGRARVMSCRAEDPTAVQNADIIVTQAERSPRSFSSCFRLCATESTGPQRRRFAQSMP